MSAMANMRMHRMTNGVAMDPCARILNDGGRRLLKYDLAMACYKAQPKLALSDNKAKIDGGSPELFLRKRAKELRAEVGDILAKPKFGQGEWTLEVGLHGISNKIPPKKEVIYTIKSKYGIVKVQVPYAAMFSPCGQNSIQGQPLKQVLKWSNDTPPQMGLLEIYLWRGRYFQTSRLDETGILVVPTFEGVMWIEEIEYAIETLNGSQNIIVDLRHSSVGSTYRAEFLESQLALRFPGRVVAIVDPGCYNACKIMTLSLPTITFSTIPISSQILPYSPGTALDPYLAWLRVKQLQFK